MTIERRNPLPKGRYWVDIVDSPKFPGARITFSGWLTRNSGVKVIKRESFGALVTGKARDWYLFEVLQPVVWERNRGWGFPSIVQSPENPTAPKVEKPEDTAQRPPPPTIRDAAGELFGDLSPWAWLALGVLAWSQLGKR